MVIWDEAKRQKTLSERGLDFADAEKVWAGRYFDRTDDRRDYGEQRHLTAGYLAGRFVVVTWTMRGAQRRIISMRYGHAEEEKLYQEQMG